MFIEGRLHGACNAEPEGLKYVCTRPPHDDGTHVAHRSDGSVAHEWYVPTPAEIVADLQAISSSLTPTYPRINARGETVWACCESSIGPTCNHKKER